MQLFQFGFISLLKTMVAIASMGFSTLSISQDVTRHQVAIYQFKFVPDTLTIKPGDTVVWTNKDIVPHTATASNGLWDSGEILTGQSQSVVFNKDMLLSYYCRFHPKMKARLKILMDENE